MKIENIENVTSVGKFVQAHLDLNTYDAVRSMALRDGKSLGDFLLLAIKDYIERRIEAKKEALHP